MAQYLFTSESVTEGHPDEVCDQISDALVDSYLNRDPNSRVAVEASVKNNELWLFGEVSSQAFVDPAAVARAVINKIGYNDDALGFTSETCKITQTLDRQSPDIAGGVNEAQEKRVYGSQDQFDLIGAGDQGIMFGGACTQTPEMMPYPIAVAHRLARYLAKARKTKALPYLRPDGKTQVSVVYEDGKPIAIDTILISTQHEPDVSQAEIRGDLGKAVIEPAFADLPIRPNKETKLLVNPTGKFAIGGPVGDSGLTGRKIIVDTYGGYFRHGGGAFSGKDPTKVDRSAAYACRYIAKNIVVAGLADRCEVQIGYAIGVARPVSIRVETFGTGKVSDEAMLSLVKANFELRPAGIINMFDLQRLPASHNGSFYTNLAAYGHFGRLDLDLPWERVDKVSSLL